MGTGARPAPDWARVRSQGAWAWYRDGRARGSRGAQTNKAPAPRVHGEPPRKCPCSLVEQGWLGWADNGGPAGRSRGSSAAKRIKIDREGETAVRLEAGQR